MSNGRNDMGMGGGPGGPGGPGPRGGSFDDPSEEDKVVCRLLIPTRLAGALIGKRGETVNRMRMEFNCEISIPTSTTSERTLRVMSSEHKSVVSCIKAILDEIGEDLRRSGRVMEEEQTELRLLMHTSHAGYVIGQGGKNIKQLRTDTNCRIIINTEHCPYSTDRVCQISGTAEDVMSCVDKVLIMVDETPIKGEKSRYNANFANDKVDYGGYKSGTRRSDRRFGSGDGREALEDQRMNYNGNNNNGNGSYNGREDDGQNNRGRYNNNNNRNDRYDARNGYGNNWDSNDNNTFRSGNFNNNGRYNGSNTNTASNYNNYNNQGFNNGRNNNGYQPKNDFTKSGSGNLSGGGTAEAGNPAGAVLSASLSGGTFSG